MASKQLRRRVSTTETIAEGHRNNDSNKSNYFSGLSLFRFIFNQSSKDHSNDQVYSQSDQKIAEQLQEKEASRSKTLTLREARRRKRLEENDRKYAQQLQLEEAKIRREVMQDIQQRAMLQTNFGKAVILIERIIELIENLKRTEPDMASANFETIAKDEMVIFAERLLEKQDDFKAKGLPTTVDIGYHYTSNESINGIKKHGLLTKTDRKEKSIDVRAHGLSFGDGIYTSNNPDSFTKYGNVGLIVARLQGAVVRVPFHDSQRSTLGKNTVIGNKRSDWPKSDAFNEVVLKSSDQCLPLIRYNSRDKALIGKCSEHLKLVIDEIFNQNKCRKNNKR